MSYRPSYHKGDWLATCDVCARKFKASALKQRWDGLMACSDDWEARQPQDFVRGVPDPQIVPWIRDEASDTFDNFCAIRDKYPLASVGTAGCCVCGAYGDTAVAGYALASLAVTGVSIKNYWPFLL